MKADRVTERRKLIEVALPLEAINKEAAREKSIRHGHPSTLHLWWARRPLAAVRAVLFAQLVDDPDSRPEAEAIADPDERAAWVSAERTRLFRLIEELVKWENSTNDSVLSAARAEIMRSTNGNPPAILDPFAGGGTIPLEAQRLGLEAHASDLNPVAVLINKALIETPPKFAGRPPVFPGAADSRLGAWPRATGLAEDVRRYGAWMRIEAEKRLGLIYPKATLSDGSTATVIAWIWARTVICPNPACGIRMPLVRSWWLGKKKGKEAYVVHQVLDGKVQFTVGHDVKNAPTEADDGTVGRAGATCISCGTAVGLDYVRSESRGGRLEAQLMATVAEGDRRRIYLAPDSDQTDASAVPVPLGVPQGELFDWPGRINVVRYGLTRFADLFTNRQLVALTAFSDLIGVARERVLADAMAAGMSEGDRLSAGGTGAAAYADAIETYLGFAVSRLSSTNSSLCRWNSAPSKESVSDTFGRQALPMVWDFAEGNPLCKGPCNLDWSCGWVARVLDYLPDQVSGVAVQRDARRSFESSALVSTDPPYYDNIGYSDLSDFFYVWLRRSLRDAYPDLLSTLLVPKADELVANPYRHGGKDGARSFFEAGFQNVFASARKHASEDFPIAVYYAYKQAESADDGDTSSTGWQTLLDGMVRGGWRITGTWPMRSERGGRMISIGSNALASSIVLALRPRAADAPMADRRAFTAELRETLPEKLRELQQGSIAAVDLPQSAIGPGMAVFSQYAKVVEADGEPMTVSSALQVINQVLGEVLWQQEGDFDAGTRWCVKWFESNGFAKGEYGVAENLASAYNTSVKGLDRSGALTSVGGVVQLLSPDQLAVDYDPRADDHITLWEVVLHLAKALDEQGLDAAGRTMSRASGRVDLDSAKELAYLVFSIANDKKWSGIAQLFNLLAASWADVVDAARRSTDDRAEQLTLESTY